MHEKQRKIAIHWLVFVLSLPFDLIKAGATQTETSLLKQYDPGERVRLLDDFVCIIFSNRSNENAITDQNVPNSSYRKFAARLEEWPSPPLNRERQSTKKEEMKRITRQPVRAAVCRNLAKTRGY